jgi:hypothetical protein
VAPHRCGKLVVHQRRIPASQPLPNPAPLDRQSPNPVAMNVGYWPSNTAAASRSRPCCSRS